MAPPCGAALLPRPRGWSQTSSEALWLRLLSLFHGACGAGPRGERAAPVSGFHLFLFRPCVVVWPVIGRSDLLGFLDPDMLLVAQGPVHPSVSLVKT